MIASAAPPTTAATLNLTMAAAEFAPCGIRVNAIAPGFFLGKQNKSLLIDDTTGNYTERGPAVLNHTPFGRFGEVGELAAPPSFSPAPGLQAL
jgi:NAD(P)-dependent dehydrogenase (short-subunit alcohol dehydrogenase family)